MLDISLFEKIKEYENDTTIGAFDVTNSITSYHVKPFKGNESAVIMEFIGAKVFKAISQKVGIFTPAEGTLAIHNGNLVFASQMLQNFHSINAENKKIKSSVARRKRNENLESAYPFFFFCSEDDRSQGNVGMDDCISMIDFARFAHFLGRNVKKIVNKFFSLWKDPNMYDPTKYPKMNLMKTAEALEKINEDLEKTIFNAIEQAIQTLYQTEGIELASIEFTFKNIDTDTRETKKFETLEELAYHIKEQISFNTSAVLPDLKAEVQRQLEIEKNESYLEHSFRLASSSSNSSLTALTTVPTNTVPTVLTGDQKRRCMPSSLSQPTTQLRGYTIN